MRGTLYVVGTPIGNLEDISLRALRILREVDIIAAEDTRVSRKLLSHYDIHTPLTSYHQHSTGAKLDALGAKLTDGRSIALVSDAGMPGISDPGADLIARAIEIGADVVPIPGPNAAISGLVVSGLPAGRFQFDGFPPRTKTDRKEYFARLARRDRTAILYESAQRIEQTLTELYHTSGDCDVALARELTKKFEELFRGRLTAALKHLSEHKPRGEFTIVIGPPEKSDDEAAPDLAAMLKQLAASGRSSRDTVLEAARLTGLPRRTVYRTLLDLEQAGAVPRNSDGGRAANGDLTQGSPAARPNKKQRGREEEQG